MIEGGRKQSLQSCSSSSSSETDPGRMLARLFPFLLLRKFPAPGISAVGRGRESEGQRTILVIF